MEKLRRRSFSWTQWCRSARRKGVSQHCWRLHLASCHQVACGATWSSEVPFSFQQRVNQQQ